MLCWVEFDFFKGLWNSFCKKACCFVAKTIFRFYLNTGFVPTGPRLNGTGAAFKARMWHAWVAYSLIWSGDREGQCNSLSVLNDVIGSFLDKENNSLQIVISLLFTTCLNHFKPPFFAWRCCCSAKFWLIFSRFVLGHNHVKPDFLPVSPEPPKAATRSRCDTFHPVGFCFDTVGDPMGRSWELRTEQGVELWNLWTEMFLSLVHQCLCWNT